MTMQHDLCFMIAYPCTFDVTIKPFFTVYIFEKLFVVGLDAAEQPLILMCLLTALKVYSVQWF